MFDRLAATLHALAFDPSRDRLFSTGDIIDRGAGSALALEWIGHAWFRPVLGNHEAMLIDPLPDEDSRRQWLMANGGGWWLDQPEADRERFLAALRALPVACTVNTRLGRVGIVHADVPQAWDWDAFVAALERGDGTARHYALWSRARLSAAWSTPVTGVDRVYCGHTPVPIPQQLGNVRFIDTGACYGGTLTVECIDPPC